jgi:methionyl-tRNA formyltransferase
VTVSPPAEIRRLVYLGTPDVAVPPLRALVAAGYDVALVVSGEDRRRGRGGRTSASPVKQAASDLGIPVSTEIESVLGMDADLGVVVAFGGLIESSVLDVLPMVNIHFSLLPRWRGAAPVERAILAGDEKTGVCLMVVDHELDTGAIYRREVVPIGPDETLEELRMRLVGVGTDLLVDALAEGLGEPEAQIGEPVYAAKITSSDLRIDWSRPAEELHRLVRLGGAWTTFRNRRLKIHRAVPVAGGPGPGRLDGVVAGTGVGGLELVEVQPEGRSVQAAADWLRGTRPGADEMLGR